MKPSIVPFKYNEIMVFSFTVRQMFYQHQNELVPTSVLNLNFLYILFCWPNDIHIKDPISTCGTRQDANRSRKQ